MMQIGSLQVFLPSRELTLDGKPVRIGSRAFDILEQLILADGKVVSKDDLIVRVWPNTIVEENNLQVHMSTLRKLLGASRDLIKTIPGRGYQLAAGNREHDRNRVKLCRDSAFIRGNMPVMAATLIGRDAAVTNVCNLLDQGRHVTLVGTGGIGKTRLAIEVVRASQHRFIDGVIFASLALAVDTRTTIEILFKAVGAHCANGPYTPKQLVTELGKQNVLVVLDNCEHIVRIAAELAETITADNANASVLATSREALRTAEETVYPVQPLSVPHKNDENPQVLRSGAVKLFLSRARAVDANFSLDAQSIVLSGTVCRRLDGIPLALELAAARAAVIGIQTLATHLDDRFRILTGGHRTALPRHQTLKATLDWSYDLLTGNEQFLLRRVSSFMNGFTISELPAVVEEMVLTETETIDALTGLIAKSLVVVGPDERGKRYRLNETTRAYALQKLEDHGEDRTVAGNHARYLLHKLRAQVRSQAGLKAPANTAWFADDIDDLRQALRWASSSRGDPSISAALTAVSAELFYDL